MPIELEQLRALVYDSLVRTHQELGMGNQPLSLSAISAWVTQKAQQRGLLPQSTHFNQVHLEKADEDAIRECIWSLIIQGIVVPGSSNDSYNANLPWIQVTDWGKMCLAKGEYVPYDSGIFLGRVRSQIPGIDPIVILYLTEALGSFRSGNYLAVAVMVGVASERILIVLRDTICDRIKEHDGKTRFTKATENQTAKRIYDAVKNRIEPIREQLPSELQESIGTNLEGIFQLIRRTRNDAGHPTGMVIEKDEAYALLKLFPIYAKSAYALMGWLKATQI